MTRFTPLAIAALVLALAGCEGRPARDAQIQPAVLRVANQRGSTRALMEASGALAGTPYRIVWSEFAAASPLIEALSAGAVDVGGVGDAPFAFAHAAGAPIKAVLAYRSAINGASVAVVALSGTHIRTPRDLVGRKVATVKGSIGHYLLIRLLERDHIDPRSVQTVFLDPSASRSALMTGAVDAWSTWSPYLGVALLGDHDRLIADGGGMFSGYGFLVANQTAIRDRPAALQDFTDRMRLALLWARDHPDAYARRLAKDTGLPLDVAADTARRTTYMVTPISAAVISAENEVLDHYRKAGVVDTRAEMSDAFDARFDRTAQTH